jgi:predicted phage terminase large subunit-like protein
MPPFEPVDLPGQDRELQATPTDVLRDMAEEGKNDLFFFDNWVLGYKDMTVPCHGPLCNFFQLNPSRFKRALYPRDHFKTSVITIGANLQLAVRDPEQRIHIKNEREENAERFLAAIQQHCLGNQRFRTLYGQLIPPDVNKVRWNKTEMDLLGRSGVYPEPTISCSGMSTATTSNHYSHLCYDDPVSEKAVESESVMESSKQRMKGSMALLSKPLKDTIWIVGTRWAYDDVYSWWDKTYGRLTAKLSRGAIEDGQPIFPELISLEFLDMQRAADEYLFSCNYMNNPRNVELQDLDVAALMRWQYADDYQDRIVIYDPRSQNQDILAVVDVDKLDITVTVDLAMGERVTSDRNAINVMGVEPTKGYCVVLEAWGKRCTPLELIEKLFAVNEKWHPRLFGIEAVAYQKSLSYFLRQEMERRGKWFQIKDLKAIGKKEVRIRGLQPIVKTSRVAIHPEQQLLIQEMSDFPLGEHDDVVDAFSMQLQVASHWFSQDRIARYRQAEDRQLRRAGLILPSSSSVDPLDEYWDRRVGRWANVRQTNLFP